MILDSCRYRSRRSSDGQEDSFMPMLSLKEAYDNAKSLYDKGYYRAAVQAAHVLYKQKPHHPPVVALYVGSLLRVQRFKEGILIAKRSLRHITFKDHRIAIINQLSEGLTQAGQLDDAIEMIRLEFEKQPNHPSLIAAYTHLLVVNNQREDAVEFIDSLREQGIEDLVTAAVFGRAVLRTDRRDEAIEWITKLLKENEDADPNQKQQALNSLGHLLDRAKRYDEAMVAFKESNKQIDPGFIERRHQVVVDSINQNWTFEQMKSVQRPEPSGIRPIFIVGMPRSGTTLTEQIIDAHPKGFGAGELGFLSELFISIAHNELNPYETNPKDYTPEQIAEVARVYREETAAMVDDESVEVIVDKAPMNFHYLGLIALAFPDAKIIHCQRDPRDNCLSCFFQLLNPGHGYSFDLAASGVYYKQYRQIMEHYTPVLAQDPFNMAIFENDYEGMVANQEKRTREILDFIGLDFDPACLEFHSTGRIANTLSNEQVRQPIYKTSTKRYERYAKHIGPLVDALGDVIDDG